MATTRDWEGGKGTAVRGTKVKRFKISVRWKKWRDLLYNMVAIRNNGILYSLKELEE